ncbi:MAG: hypothetical protein JWM43_1201 [Acidobacteriaceae bacterium]|nr:hypothetical protein [Acidobacteriaceae bacterium]
MVFLSRRWWRRWGWELSGLAAGLILPGVGAAQCVAADSLAHVVSVQKDVVLGSRWGVTVRCDHPEWPARMAVVPAEAGGVAEVLMRVAPAVPELVVRVRVGESVRLWQEDAMARIEMFGTAEESGAEGARVRVRFVRKASDGGDAKGSVVGVVRGVGSVEMVR